MSRPGMSLQNMGKNPTCDDSGTMNHHQNQDRKGQPAADQGMTTMTTMMPVTQEVDNVALEVPLVG